MSLDTGTEDGSGTAQPQLRDVPANVSPKMGQCIRQYAGIEALKPS